jgi:WD40 repeat protein
MRTLSGHVARLRGVVFSPDGRLLATGSTDATAKVWDPATGDCLRTLAGHAEPVYGVAFSADGRLLATSSIDKTVKVWN